MNTSVINQHIDPSLVGHHGLDQLLHLVLVSNITSMGHDWAAGFLTDGIGYLAYLFLLDIGQYHRRSLDGTSISDGGTQSLGSAGNEDHLSVQVKKFS
jgi:hypothetical protein